MKSAISLILAAIICSIATPATAAIPPTPTCVPGQADTLFTKRRHSDDTGWFGAVGCKKDGRWEITGVACRHGVCVPQQWMQAFFEIDRVNDPAQKWAVFDGWWKQIVTTDCDAALPPNAPNADTGICEAMTAAVADLSARINPPPPPPPPPPPQYQVAKAAANANPPGTLPVYRWNGTTLGSVISGVRAPQGEACDCSIRYEGASLYCAVPILGRTDALARCEAKP